MGRGRAEGAAGRPDGGSGGGRERLRPYDLSPGRLRVAVALCALFGYLGAHRFYLRQYRMGTLYLLTVGCLLVGWVRDLGVLLSAALRRGRLARRLGTGRAAGQPAPGPELWTVAPDASCGAPADGGRIHPRAGRHEGGARPFDPAYVDPEVAETFAGYEPPDAEELFDAHEGS